MKDRKELFIEILKDFYSMEGDRNITTEQLMSELKERLKKVVTSGEKD
ncbi:MULTISPECIES: hypothetical protein [Bacillus]|nr:MULTISPECIES: hypothetical protein [Bacillus]